MMNQEQRLRRCPPPRNFRPAGSPRGVELALRNPPFIKPRRVKGARAAGIRYERKVQAHLVKTYPNHYVASPWFTFYHGEEVHPRWCQPDGILMDIRAGRIIIIEVKLQHTSDAYWQTRHLYQPVLQAFFGTDQWTYSIVEVVRWYDPDALFPERYRLVPDIPFVELGKFGVHIWRS